MKTVDYEIISKPDYIRFECPHCKGDCKVPFDKVDYITDYWGDGGFVDCPECGKEVELSGCYLLITAKKVMLKNK